MTPTRAALRQLDLGLMANAIAAAEPAPQQAPSLLVKTTRRLMALPVEVRNTLSVVRQRPESTEQQLTELVAPTGTLESIKTRQERLSDDLQKLAGAQASVAGARRFDEADQIGESLALLNECFNLLSHECDIRLSGDTLLNHYRDLGTLLQTAGMSYAEGQQRIRPTPPGGAPHHLRALTDLSDERIAALDIHLQHALAAPTRDQLLSHLATLTFELNSSSLHPDRYFVAWFATRVVLETRQLSAPDLLDSQVFRDMQQRHLNAEEIQQNLSQAKLLSLDNQAIGLLVATLANAAQHGSLAPDDIKNSLTCPQLLPLRKPREPQHDAIDDPAWDLVETPPASPRA